MIEAGDPGAAPVLPVLLALAGLHLLAVVVPGANTALLLASAARSRRLGLAAAAGFWPAGVLLSAAGMFGLGAALEAAPAAGAVLRASCGAYLAWLGVGLIRRAGRPAGPAAEPDLRRVLRRGFLTNLTNPKSVAYFASVFAATGAEALPPGWKVLVVLGLPSIGAAWYGGLALAASSGPARAALGRGRAWVDRTAGAVMLLLGLRLVAGR